MEIIIRLPSLLYVSFVECGIRDSSARRIGDLCRHKRMKELNLSGNELEETACIFIGNRLSRKKSFSLSGSMRIVFVNLAENNSLTSLNLSWNWIRSYASIALFRGFEVIRFLEKKITFSSRLF